MRSKVASMLTHSLGREVRFEGALKLEISAHPKLLIGGLHIANAAGFKDKEFASLGEARLALDLLPLLRLRLQIEELAGNNVQIHLQLKKNGSNNWTFNSHQQSNQIEANSKQANTENQGALEFSKLLTLLDIKRVTLENLDVEFIGINSKSHFFELQSLVAELPAGEAVTLKLQGKVEKTLPYQLNFTGGTIAELANRDQPWPVNLTLAFMSCSVSLSGSVSDNTGSINFGIGSENIAEFEQLLQIKIPAVGVAGIAGDLSYSPGKIILENLNGTLGKTTLNGSLNLDYSAEIPRLQGDLSLPMLDLRPFVTSEADSKDVPAQSLAEVYRALAKSNLNLAELKSLNANLTLRVGQIVNMPDMLSNAKLQLKLEQGRLTLPIQVNLAKVALSGQASADASMSPTRFKFELGTHDSSLGNLAELLLGIPNIQGKLGDLKIKIAARGDNGSTLMESLDIRLNVKNGKLSYGNGVGERPVQFSLDKLLLVLPAGKPLQGDTNGTLLGKPFVATLRGGSLIDTMLSANVPIDFELKAGSASAQIHSILQSSTNNSASVISFKFYAPHSNEISQWLGLKAGADVSVKLRGNLLTENENWKLSDFLLQLGNSELSAEMQRTKVAGESNIKLSVTGNLIDLDELQSLQDSPKKKSKEIMKVEENIFDIPILPTKINLANADIDVRINRITSSSPFTVRDVRFDGLIRDGMMSPSPFSAIVADKNFNGALMLDMRSQQPHALLWLSVDDLDIGNILHKLGISSNINAGVDHLGLQLDLHSSRLGDLLSQSELLANFEGGHVTLTDANTGGKMNIALENGELKSAAGEPVIFNLQGSIDHTPVSIVIQTAKANDLINPKLSVPFNFFLATSGTAMNLSGEIDRPFSNKDIELVLEMSGNNLDNLNSLTHTSLPPWGPWSASGNFQMSSSGYEVSSLLLQVGSSQLSGHGKIDTKIVPPRIDVSLISPTIQIDDFRLGNWSPEKSKPSNNEKSELDNELKPQANAGKIQAKNIFSPEILLRQNAYLNVKVDKVISGQDLLGNGKLDAKLENGHATIGPVVVNTPGGSASFRLGYEPGVKDILVSLRADVKNFDYGILARRIDKQSEMSGIFSLDIDVSARAQYFADLLRNGKGHINFAVWPENLKSGLLDIWAVNVMMALLPAIDSSNESKVNCAIGRFVLKDGKLSDKTFLIDTNRMRVKGKGSVNFATEDILLYVKPQAKTPQFLSLAIPIELNGNFNDFHVGIRTTDLLETVGQLATSIIWVPLEMLIGKETPADGKDVCATTEYN